MISKQTFHNLIANPSPSFLEKTWPFARIHQVARPSPQPRSYLSSGTPGSKWTSFAYDLRCNKVTIMQRRHSPHYWFFVKDSPHKGPVLWGFVVNLNKLSNKYPVIWNAMILIWRHTNGNRGMKDNGIPTHQSQHQPPVAPFTNMV